MSAIGTVLRERYEIIAELGKGGMSTVFLAKDKILDSYWAVKQVKNSTSIDIEAFKKEVELLSSLSHSDIPRIIDRIEVGDDFFVIMDFIDGISLGKKVLVEGPLPEHDVVEWAKMLCDVLEYLHTVKQNPIIYRDMKPDNIMLINSGRVKLIDFGIAKECRRGERQTGSSIGTRGYAAPEQYKGASNILDERTDIYSLGATLFYLVTGSAPGKPPKAIRPIRQINPALSEGLEYIILKCTDDDPANRYQNCRELKADLNNIQQLTSSYRRKMSRKLLSFVACFAACLIFMSVAFIGNAGMSKEREDNYQHYYDLAINADRSGDYATAAVNYEKAVSYKQDSLDTHMLYFNALLPQDGDENGIIKTKEAVDIMRTKYIDNQQSPMYHNDELMYQVSKRSIEVNDPVYAAFAVNYIGLLREHDFSADDLGGFEIIALNCAKNMATQDFTAFGEALTNLEQITDTAALPANDKLENYYTVMVMYSEYPANLSDAYTRIYDIGKKAKELIDSNLNSEDLTFNSIIPMYELVASSLYNHAVSLTDSTEKESELNLCLEWFGYLDDLNDDLSESLWIKKANTYKGIFDIYNTSERLSEMNDTVTGHLDSAIAEFEKIITTYPDSFLALVHLTRATLDRELLKPAAADRDFADTLKYHDQLTQMKNSDRNLSNISLSQFSSLKQAMVNAGLEE